LFIFAVYPNYPFTVYFLGLWIYAIWMNYREQFLVRECQTTCANPVVLFRAAITGRINGLNAFIIAMGQFIGALLAYPLVIFPAWSFVSNWFFNEFNFHNMEISAHYWPTGALVVSRITSVVYHEWHIRFHSNFEFDSVQAHPFISALVEGSGTCFICILPTILRGLDPMLETPVFIFATTLVAALSQYYILKISFLWPVIAFEISIL